MLNEYWIKWRLESKRERISKNIETDGLGKAYNSRIDENEGRTEKCLNKQQYFQTEQTHCTDRVKAFEEDVIYDEQYNWEKEKIKSRSGYFTKEERSLCGNSFFRWRAGIKSLIKRRIS